MWIHAYFYIAHFLLVPWQSCFPAVDGCSIWSIFSPNISVCVQTGSTHARVFYHLTTEHQDKHTKPSCEETLHAEWQKRRGWQAEIKATSRELGANHRLPCRAEEDGGVNKQDNGSRRSCCCRSEEERPDVCHVTWVNEQGMGGWITDANRKKPIKRREQESCQGEEERREP